MPDTQTPRTAAYWKTVNAGREHLVDAQGVVIAEIFRRRFTLGWGFTYTKDLRKLSGFANTREEAKQRAQGQFKPKEKARV